MIALAILVGWQQWGDFMARKAKAPADKEVAISAAVKNLSESLGLTSNELVESLTDAAKLRDELTEVKKKSVDRETERQQYRAEMEEKLRQTDLNIEALNREYTQTINSLQESNKDLQNKYGLSRRALVMVLDALRVHEDIVIPGLDDLLFELNDSIYKWKWKK